MRVLIPRFLQVGLRTAHPCLSVFMLVGLLFPALAAAVTPNTAPTFIVSDGKVATAIGSFDDYGKSVTIQVDGKILVAGSGSSGSSDDFALVRYNVDGSLDTTFGTGGKVTTDIGSFYDYGNSVTIQADGKILVAGTGSNGSYTDFALVRYNVDGSLDTTFGTGGKVTTDFFNNHDSGNSVTVQADGKILVAGDCSNNNWEFALARYNIDGSLDMAFGTGGKVTTDISSMGEWGNSVTIQADGKILVAGSSSNGNEMALVRYNTDGSLDINFDTDGRVTTSGVSGGGSVFLQADGKILVAGQTWSDFALVRYNPDGSLDTAFDNDGIVTTDFGSGEWANSVTVQADGKILVAGTTSSGFSFILARYNVDGSLDTSFDTDGKVKTDSSGVGHSVTVQADGKILVAGDVHNGTNWDIGLVRYNSDGSLDTSFSPPENTLDASPVFTEPQYYYSWSTVVLDANVQIVDAELAAANSYNGATLTLARHAGASAQDVFLAQSGGTLTTLLAGSYFSVNGVTIGRVTTNDAGTLTFTFNANATQSLVDRAMQQIAYANTSDAPPATVQIDWTFNDGNTGAQGTGGALSVVGSTTVQITATNDPPTLAVPISDIYVQANTALNYVIPSNTFLDLDGETLSLSVTMTNGTGLPPWLTFTSATRTLSGTPIVMDIGAININISATDSSGASATDTVVLTVGKVSQTIGAISFSPTTLVVGGTTTASATATSGLAVSFSSTNTSICTVSGSTVTGVTAGTCTIAANQAGNATYNAAPQATQTIVVAKRSQTVGPITFLPATLAIGGATTASATSTSTLAVTFTSTPLSVCTASGINGKTITGIAAGTCTIAANQAGNANYNAAPQVTQNITVGKANQTITFGVAPSVIVGGTGTVAATGGSSGNAVTFTSTTTGICTISGSTVTGIAAGTCTVAANQSGNANYNAAPQATQNITVGKRSQTIGPITFLPATLVVGGTTTASATATSGLPVTFSTASSACTATGTSGRTITGVATGSCIINANQAGNASYNPAPLRAQTIAVAAATPAVSLNRTALIFAARRPGTISPAQAVTLRNTGTAALNITGIVASGDFARTTTCAATLAAGASCTISVTFTATAMGARTELVTLTSNAAGSPHRITLTGTGKGTRHDFNGDGKSDLLWRNPSTGANQIWFMNGGLKISTANTTPLAAPWAIAGVDDFNGDGKADILWRHPTTRQTVIWLMNGITRLSSTVVSPVVVAPWATAWNIAGTGDFNGDGKADILWRSNLTTGLTAGANQIWLMNGAIRTTAANTTTAATALAVAGVADFNGDGKTDILWRNAATGQDAVWLMNGAAVMAGSGATGTLPAPWTIAGTGDFNGDGKADILWRNPTTGLDSIWFMNGKAAAGATTNAAATVWSVAGVADFNGDGKADITWRYPATGATQLWLMNGAARSAAATLTPAMLAPWGVAK